MAAPSGRVYSAYDAAYQKRPDVRLRHIERLRARRQAEKKYGKEALKGMDVDHIRALKGGGSNAPSNIRLRPVHSNRADKTYYN
jgi:hypothetical protein